jgi:transporter family protein
VVLFGGFRFGHRLELALLFPRLQLGEASKVAPVDKLSVVFAIALAAAFLGEKLTWHQWLGGALILAGAVIIALKPA